MQFSSKSSEVDFLYSPAFAGLVIRTADELDLTQVRTSVKTQDALSEERINTLYSLMTSRDLLLQKEFLKLASFFLYPKVLISLISRCTHFWAYLSPFP